MIDLSQLADIDNYKWEISSINLKRKKLLNKPFEIITWHEWSFFHFKHLVCGNAKKLCMDVHRIHESFHIFHSEINMELNHVKIKTKCSYILLIDLLPTIEIVRVKWWSVDAKIYEKNYTEATALKIWVLINSICR